MYLRFDTVWKNRATVIRIIRYCTVVVVVIMSLLRGFGATSLAKVGVFEIIFIDKKGRNRVPRALNLTRLIK